MSRRRVVFDTSTLVSAALKEGSIPYRALFLALDLHEVCVSEETLNELGDVLMRAKFDDRIARSDRLNFLSLVSRETSTISVDRGSEELISPRCRDAKDDKFLSLAEAGKIEALVSSDKDLLVLNPWNGIEILTPADFLAQFQDR